MRRSILLALCLAPASACENSIGITDQLCPDQGTFQGSLSGNISTPSRDLKGCTTYVVASVGWTMTLVDTISPMHRLVLSGAGVRPANGTHTLGPNAPYQGTFTIGNDVGTARSFTATNGAMTVTLSLADRLDGTITATVREGGPGTPTVNLSVTFSSKCFTSDSTTC